MENCQIYLEKFTAWGAAPSVEGYLALFDPEATLQHPGMAKPISGDEIRGFIAGREVVWPEALCLKLRGDRVLVGRAYYDPNIG